MVVSENGLDGHDFLLCLLKVVLIVVLNEDCVVGTTGVAGLTDFVLSQNRRKQLQSQARLKYCNRLPSLIKTNFVHLQT